MIMECVLDAKAELGEGPVWDPVAACLYFVDITAGLTVVCNGSRSIVADLRARYPQCCVVLITAPEDVRRARAAACLLAPRG